MSRYDLTNFEWHVIEPLLPNKPRGTPRVDDRRVLNGIGEDKLPMILGGDLAGTIKAVGTRAHYMLSKGNPVFAYIGFDRSAQSEFDVERAMELMAAPKSIDLVHAAAVALAAMTARQGSSTKAGWWTARRSSSSTTTSAIGPLSTSRFNGPT